MTKYKRFIFNPLQVNTWVIYSSSGDCLIIDPACSNEKEEKELSNFIEQEGLTPLAVVITHGHFDHVPGVQFVKSLYDCPFIGHENEQELVNYAPEQGSLFGFNFGSKPPVIDEFLIDGEILEKGSIHLLSLHVPGHSSGSLAFFSKEGKFVVVGDVLFKGSIGRTDLPGGNYETLIQSIRSKLLTLPEETLVMPGHGPETTIGQERISNPFLT